MGRDVSERKASEARYRLLFERNLAGVFRTGADGRILECNDACARIFGFESRDEFLRRRRATISTSTSAERERVVQMLREQRQISNLELRLRRRDGSTVWVLENVSLLDGDILEGTIIDITDRKHAQEQIEYQAYHDALTGLPNRLLFRDRITVALAHARRSTRVERGDVPRPRSVQARQRHPRPHGRRPAAAGHRRAPGDLRARRGHGRAHGRRRVHDPARRSRTIAAARPSVAQKVLEAVRHPVIVDEHELYVTTTIGIAIFPDDGDDAETLLKNADRAMYRAKELGRDNYQFATPATFEIARRAAGAGERACAARWSAKSSCCTTSRWWRSPPDASSARRRWCAGTIPSAA